jgi:hypothetical protein
MTRGGWAVLVVASVATAVACTTSGGGAPGDWFRLYAGPTETVWHTTLELLADQGYVVDTTDVEHGRIRAHSGDQLGVHGVELILEVTATGDLVRVTASARGSETGPGAHRYMEEAVVGFLRLLDERMRDVRAGSGPEGM